MSVLHLVTAWSDIYIHVIRPIIYHPSSPSIILRTLTRVVPSPYKVSVGQSALSQHLVFAPTRPALWSLFSRKGINSEFALGRKFLPSGETEHPAKLRQLGAPPPPTPPPLELFADFCFKSQKKSIAVAPSL